MLGATLSFLGLYEYDDTLFDGLVFPAGVNRDTLIENFLAETAELEVIYPDPYFMKRALTIYGRRQAAVWASLAETFDLSYNPIWNVDGTVKEVESRDLKHSDSGSRTTFGTSGTTRKENGSSTSDGTTEDQRAGYNSSTYGNDSKTISNGSGTANLTVTEAGNNSGTDKDSRSGTDTGTIKHETVRTGNVGVTTTQQMLREELDIRPKLNIYEYIIEDLKSRFCLLIY